MQSKQKVPPGLRIALGCIGIAMLGLIAMSLVSRLQDAPAITEVTASSSDWRCNVRKSDGTIDGRECDLLNLCRDAKFYDDKSAAAAGAGDSAGAQKNAGTLASVLASMREYRHEDVVRVCNPATLDSEHPTEPKIAADPAPASVRAANVAVWVPKAAVCDTQPNQLFKTGAVLSDAALDDLIAKHCHGASATLEGDYELQWSDHTFLVEMKGSHDAHEVAGVWLK